MSKIRNTPDCGSVHEWLVDSSVTEHYNASLQNGCRIAVCSWYVWIFLTVPTPVMRCETARQLHTFSFAQVLPPIFCMAQGCAWRQIWGPFHWHGRSSHLNNVPVNGMLLEESYGTFNFSEGRVLTVQLNASSDAAACDYISAGDQADPVVSATHGTPAAIGSRPTPSRQSSSSRYHQPLAVCGMLAAVA